MSCAKLKVKFLSFINMLSSVDIVAQNSEALNFFIRSLTINPLLSPSPHLSNKPPPLISFPPFQGKKVNKAPSLLSPPSSPPLFHLY